MYLVVAPDDTACKRVAVWRVPSALQLQHVVSNVAAQTKQAVAVPADLKRYPGIQHDGLVHSENRSSRFVSWAWHSSGYWRRQLDGVRLLQQTFNLCPGLGLCCQ